MLNKIKLSTKLIGGFIIVALITLIVGIVGWYGVSSVNGNLDTIAQNYLKSIKRVSVINERQTGIRSHERSLLIRGIDDEERENQYTMISEAWNTFNVDYERYKEMKKDSEEEKLWQAVVSSFENWKKSHEEFMKLSKEYNQSRSDIDYEKMLNYYMDTERSLDLDLCNKLELLVNYNNNASDKAAETAAASAAAITVTEVAGMIIGTIIALILGIFLSVSITKPMLAAVNGLNEGAQQVASASEQLSAASQQLAEGNAEQASSIEETSSTLEESASMVQQNSENTKQAAMLAGQTKGAADKGNIEMQEMLSSMGEIKKSSDQISKIIKVIDEIAFQTNMLALNAAVEAARAGDAGMGFAVVAEEVRNLAQRSAQAAKDTAAIIETNIELSEKGVNVAKKVGESLSEITVQAKKVNELMDEIAAASQEQSQGIGQINKAIVQMEKVTQMNASSAEESASSSEELSAQALKLREIVQQLVKMINGHSDKNAFIQNDMSANFSSHNGNSAFQQTAATYHQANNVHGMKAIDSSSKNLTRAMASNSLDTNKAGRKTHIVNPDEVIPLDHDKRDF